MKKLMIATLAGLCAAVTFGLESQVVGYQAVKTDSTLSPSFGVTFTPVDGKTYYTLGDITVSGMAAGNDVIQVLDPETTSTTAQYTYFSKEEADQLAIDEGGAPGDYDDFVGWWDSANLFNDGGQADDVEFDIGQGFLGLFPAKANISFVCKGTVPGAPTSKDTDGELSPMICNYLPKTITLSQITVDNMTAGNDVVQVLDPETTSTSVQYTYFSKAEADQLAIDEGGAAGDYDDFVGWWDAANLFNDGGQAGDVPVAAGEAFLGLFVTRANITFNFPSAF